MRPLTVLALEIYQSLGKQYSNLYERKEATKKYILTEITQWTVKSHTQQGNYFYKPVEFNGNNNSTPFSIRLIYDPGHKMHELKFGNLNAPSQDVMFKWEDNDPYRLQKALFLQKVLNQYVLPLILNGDINGILFSPYDNDGLKDDRLSYFRNMFDKVGNKELAWKETKGIYFIYKKQN